LRIKVKIYIPLSQGNIMYKKIDSFSAILEKSKKQDKPILIFKSSVFCGVSSATSKILDKYIEEHPEVEAYQLIVQEQQDMKLEIAKTLHVPHESPQVIIIKKGKATAVLNHYNITKDGVEEALK